MFKTSTSGRTRTVCLPELLQSFHRMLLDELERLKRGDFRPYELQQICHGLSEDPENEAAFRAGCVAYQKMLFGDKQDKEDKEDKEKGRHPGEQGQGSNGPTGLVDQVDQRVRRDAGEKLEEALEWAARQVGAWLTEQAQINNSTA